MHITAKVGSIVTMGRRELISVGFRLGTIFAVSFSTGAFCLSKTLYALDETQGKKVREEDILKAVDRIAAKWDEIDKENRREMTPEEIEKRQKEVSDAIKRILKAKGYEILSGPTQLRVINQ